jgi:hypothetical protein
MKSFVSRLIGRVTRRAATTVPEPELSPKRCTGAAGGQPSAYLVLITWPDGTEGLLFPWPGNVPLASTLDQGNCGFEKAKHDLQDYVEGIRQTGRDTEGAIIRLFRFTRGEMLREFTVK